MAFVLLSNAALNERVRVRPDIGGARTPLLRLFVAALGLWAGLAWMAGSMTWPPYFWTASIIFHAIMAPVSLRRRDDNDSPSTFVCGCFVSTTALVEALMACALMLTVLLRFVFACDTTGAAESKYLQFVNIATNPWFPVGLLIAVFGARYRIIFVTHASVIALLPFADPAATRMRSLVLGYSIAMLFQAAERPGMFPYALMAAAAFAAWVVGLFGFTMAGLIVVYKAGFDLTQRLTEIGGVLSVSLFGLWLVLTLVNRRSRRPGHHRAKFRVNASLRTCAGAYLGIWTVILTPLAGLMVTAMYPPVRLHRPHRVEIGAASGICHAGYSRSDEEYAVLHSLGARLIRIAFAWNQIQPAPDTWDYSSTDAFLDAAQRHGVQVVAVLAFDNDAVEQSAIGSKRCPYIAAEDIPLFEEFVRRTVDRYRDRVYAWEIWNEPDIPLFWTGTMPEFYELARRAAETARKTYPGALILGTAMTSMFGLYSAPGIEGLHASRALENVDHPSMHTYVSDPRSYYGEFLRVKNAAAKYNHPGSIWITELGIPDGGVYPWRAKNDASDEYVIKAYTTATSLGIDTLLWHCYENASLESLRAKPLDSEGFFGLLEQQGQWKPAAFAYQLFAQHCNDSVLRPDLLQVSDGLAARQLRAALYRRENGESALIMWFEPALRENAHTRVTVDLGTVDGTAISHNIGSAYHKPLLDKVVDLTETPLFITFKSQDTESPVHLAVETSSADNAWLILLAGLVICSAAMIYPTTK